MASDAQFAEPVAQTTHPPTLNRQISEYNPGKESMLYLLESASLKFGLDRTIVLLWHHMRASGWGKFRARHAARQKDV
jgi:hypothetical protein